MKVSLSLFALTAFITSPVSAQVRGGDTIITENTNVDADDEPSRKLLGGSGTSCKGPSLSRGEKLYADESICGTINGTTVYYGIRSYPNAPQTGYTSYRTEVWSANGMHDRWFSGIGTKGPAPYLQLQGDGNVVFAGQGSGCLAKPGKRGPNISMSIEGPLPDLMKVRDNDGDIIWKLGYKTLSNNKTYIGSSGCYPEIGPRCVSVLKERQRLTWNEYVCEYDESGDVVSRFGLDSHGLLALWRNGTLVWRPGPFHIRGDYLHLQGDGHLTLYRATAPTPTITWATSCIGVNDSKITVSDGDVHHFNGDGSTKWVLAGEAPLAPVCFPGCDV